jgi:peptide/nickel transport system permease protein
MLHQYLVFWKRMVQGDFGPSLSAFPTPVSVLIWRRCRGRQVCCVSPHCSPGVRQPARWPGRLLPQQPPAAPGGPRCHGLHPIIYIVAFVLLIVFGYLWPGCRSAVARR